MTGSSSNDSPGVEAAREALKTVLGGGTGGFVAAAVFNSQGGTDGALLAGGGVLVAFVIVWLILYGIQRFGGKE